MSDANSADNGSRFEPTTLIPRRGGDLTNPDGDTFDGLAEEFADRCRRGESPSIQEYEARHPEHAEKIRRLLPTVAMMEQLKRGTSSAKGKEPARPLPERLGEFRVLRELGRGGMGVVYEAVQESLGRHVALKAVHHVHLDDKRLQRFQREAQAVAQLHHTNIVPIFGVGQDGDWPYYVMQYIQGRGLDALLKEWREGSAPRGEERWRFIARAGRQCAEALQYAHEQGILHRDIKPANLLIDEQEAIWITDFGLAKLAGRDDLTASGDVIGTLRYLAPEALNGESSAQGDVYSLGLTLYELLTLAPPFGDSNPSELLRRVSEEQPVRPRRLDPAIPSDLETIILKAIAREPRHRYATAGALAGDLRRFLEDRPILARRVTPFERAWRWGRRNRMTAALMATAAASLVLAAVVGWAGYASTTKALAGESSKRQEAEKATRRADENVALSLEVFGELFDKLTPRVASLPPHYGEFDRRPPGNPGRRPGPPPVREPEPPPEFDPDREPPPDDGGEPPFDPGRPMPPPGGSFQDRPFFPGDNFGRERGMGGGPRGGAEKSNIVDDTDLLQTVLTFYDRFARRNEANPRLQGEAASAYFKVGSIYEKLGRIDDARKADSRAIEMLEDLAARFPNDKGYATKLAEVLVMSVPSSADPADLNAQETRLRRALQLIEDKAVGESEPESSHGQIRVDALAKLGAVLQRLERPDDAEATYRSAISLGRTLIGQTPRYDRVRNDLIASSEALARIRLEKGDRAEAKALLDASLADYRLLGPHERDSPRMADRLRGLAQSFRQLGEPDRAEEVEDGLLRRDSARPSPHGPSHERNPEPPRPMDD